MIRWKLTEGDLNLTMSHEDAWKLVYKMQRQLARHPREQRQVCLCLDGEDEGLPLTKEPADNSRVFKGDLNAFLYSLDFKLQANTIIQADKTLLLEDPVLCCMDHCVGIPDIKRVFLYGPVLEKLRRLQDENSDFKS